MDNKIIEGIYTMMQRVFDKLDVLSENQGQGEGNLVNNNFEELVKRQKVVAFYLNKLEKLIQENPKQVIEKRNYQIIFFGKDSPLNTKHFFWLIGFTIIIYLVFQIVTPIAYEVSELKIENTNYKLFYEYHFLKEFEEGKKLKVTPIIFNDIENRETNFVKEFNTLRAKYQDEKKSFYAKGNPQSKK